ncbi:hypothetical protein [Arthrobacter wenxiniae]|uniref:Uncharacterized protein n=1 Tax=Arthrobacter wenxiniae TaxID=2713570 RepID=A0A7Y7IID9_9MICC|nr:hypothetical protein [Arthrobacter wenxiniae]NVM96064.1 hypothetical protein [Arthrobacter wenxiniae]
MSITDATFRSDVLWASSITATDQHQVQMTVPGQDGGCQIATWTITAVGAVTNVQASTVSYPGCDATANPVTCSGTPSPASVQTFMGDAAPDSTFTYANAAGRPLTLTAGATTLGGSDTPPSGITAKQWASPGLGAVALNTGQGATSTAATGYRFAQTADNLSVVPGPADAPTHFVPEGDLTALP